MEVYMIKTNLQLFANGEETDEIDKIDLEEGIEEETEVETEGDVTEEETEVETETKQKPERMVPLKALHAEREEKKKLRDELAAIKQDKADREQVDRDKQHKQKLIDAGYTEEEAEDKVTDRREREELKRDLRNLKYSQQADKLSSKYPDIQEHLDSFISIVEASKGSLTLAELCKAKLDESTTAEIRTKAEQEALLNRQKAKGKQIVTGEDKNAGVIKFSQTDEEAYKFYASKNPSKTRKDYNEILKIRRGE